LLQACDPRQVLEYSDLEARAAAPLSTVPRAFLRWAGSKRYLLRHLVPLLPRDFGTYHEPFLGSGSLFFLLRPERAVLNDACRDLVDTYLALSRAPDLILDTLSQMRPDPELYYRIRRARSLDPARRAAEFVYLNKTAWNGLYRVNAKGDFNVPYGRPKTDNITDAANVLACSEILRRPGVDLTWGDFEPALSSVSRGDLVYLDPPYVTRHNNNGFVDYNEKLFKWSDQERLAATARRLSDAGASVLVSSANHNDVLALYRGFTAVQVDRCSTLAGNAASRGPVSEVVLVKLATAKAEVRHG
jgi:DNA adenine methylase